MSTDDAENASIGSCGKQQASIRRACCCAMVNANIQGDVRPVDGAKVTIGSKVADTDSSGMVRTTVSSLPVVVEVVAGTFVLLTRLLFVGPCGKAVVS